MYLYIGGACAGKRNAVKNRFEKVSWLSSYNGGLLSDWEGIWKDNSNLVLEGWENWILESVNAKSTDDIRQHYRFILQKLLEEENKRKQAVVLIMLEIGKGVVPMDETNRKWRDISGWVQQDAAQLATEVVQVWHGLEKTLKK